MRRAGTVVAIFDSMTRAHKDFFGKMDHLNLALQVHNVDRDNPELCARLRTFYRHRNTHFVMDSCLQEVFSNVTDHLRALLTQQVLVRSLRRRSHLSPGLFARLCAKSGIKKVVAAVRVYATFLCDESWLAYTLLIHAVEHCEGAFKVVGALFDAQISPHVWITTHVLYIVGAFRPFYDSLQVSALWTSMDINTLAECFVLQLLCPSWFPVSTRFLEEVALEGCSRGCLVICCTALASGVREADHEVGAVQQMRGIRGDGGRHLCAP